MKIQWRLLFVVALVVVPASAFYASAANEHVPSVEVGYTELSPRGAAGGYAVPASNCGDGHPDDPTDCGLFYALRVNGGVTSVTVDTGESYQLTLNPTTYTHSQCSGASPVNIRHTLYECTGSGCDPKADEFEIGQNFNGTFNITRNNPGIYRYYSYGYADAGACAGESSEYFNGYSNIVKVTVAAPPIPTPTVTFEARTNDGSGWSAWSTADLDASNPVDIGTQVQLRWSTTNADSCSGTNFSTGGATSGTTGINEPAPGNSTSYNIACTNASGDTVTDQLRVRVNAFAITIDSRVDRGGVGDVTGWSTSNRTINSSDELHVRWIITGGTASCTYEANAGSGWVANGEGFNGMDGVPDNIDTVITEPAAGNSTVYRMTCSMTHTDASVITKTRSISVDTRDVGAPIMSWVLGPNNDGTSWTTGWSTSTWAVITNEPGDPSNIRVKWQQQSGVNPAYCRLETVSGGTVLGYTESDERSGGAYYAWPRFPDGASTQGWNADDGDYPGWSTIQTYDASVNWYGDTHKRLTRGDDRQIQEPILAGYDELFYRLRCYDSSDVQIGTSHVRAFSLTLDAAYTINGGAAQTIPHTGASISLNDGDVLTMDWSTTAATECEISGPGFTNTSAALNNTNRGVTEPNQGESAEYSIRCGVGGTWVERILTIGGPALPNLTATIDNPGNTFVIGDTVTYTGDVQIVDGNVTNNFWNRFVTWKLAPGGGPLDEGNPDDIRAARSDCDSITPCAPGSYPVSSDIPTSVLGVGDYRVQLQADIPNDQVAESAGNDNLASNGSPYRTFSVRHDVDLSVTTPVPHNMGTPPEYGVDPNLIRFRSRVRNSSLATSPSSGSSYVQFQIYNSDSSGNELSLEQNLPSESIPVLQPDNSPRTIVTTFTVDAEGWYCIKARILGETNDTNASNDTTACTPFQAIAPAEPVDITVVPSTIVRRGEPVTLDIDINGNDPSLCTLEQSGNDLSHDFDPDSDINTADSEYDISDVQSRLEFDAYCRNSAGDPGPISTAVIEIVAESQER